MRAGRADRGAPDLGRFQRSEPLGHGTRLGTDVV